MTTDVLSLFVAKSGSMASERIAGVSVELRLITVKQANGMSMYSGLVGLARHFHPAVEVARLIWWAAVVVKSRLKVRSGSPGIQDSIVVALVTT